MTLGECGSYTGFRQRMAPDNAGARTAPIHPGSAASSLGKYIAMRPHNARITAAITRNFAEANEALLKLTAYDKLNGTGFNRHAASFFSIAEKALFSDMIAGAIRIFDDHKEAGSLWYIIRCHEAAAHRAARACGIDMDELRRIVPKLRHIRDKTHFHIDKRTVEDPAMVWSDTNLSRGELTKALPNAAVLLANIRNHVYGENGDALTRYDGADVSMIVDACAEAARRAEK